jgi:hypothetical protein
MVWFSEVGNPDLEKVNDVPLTFIKMVPITKPAVTIAVLIVEGPKECFLVIS